MPNNLLNPIDFNPYPFDPTYGYSLDQLLTIQAPSTPKSFTEFWQLHYRSAMTIDPKPKLERIDYEDSNWQLYKISFTSTDQFQINGWLLLPASGPIKRGLIFGHGYGGRDGPDLNCPFYDAALLFPCFRGLGISQSPLISCEPYDHVLTGIEDKVTYVIKGCVEDLWLGVSALVALFPDLNGHLGYLGISFGGGIGALGLPWDTRIARGHLNVPTFGHVPLRLRLPTAGSGASIQHYYCTHKSASLKVLRYFDAAIAAKHLSIPMHIACALFDPCVAPPGQFAIYNAIPSEKQLYLLHAGHHPYPGESEQTLELVRELERFFEPLGF